MHTTKLRRRLDMTGGGGGLQFAPPVPSAPLYDLPVIMSALEALGIDVVAVWVGGVSASSLGASRGRAAVQVCEH